MPITTDIEDLITFAAEHGENSEPDHEVGDLQTFLRVAFNILSDEQKTTFFSHAEVASTYEAARGEF